MDWCAGRRGADWAELSDTSKWNPIEDDGDALRLAVNVKVVVATYGAHVRIYTPYGEMLALEAKDQDPNYATRRAIVRAAAEIGRKMQEGGAA